MVEEQGKVDHTDDSSVDKAEEGDEDADEGSAELDAALRSVVAVGADESFLVYHGEGPHDAVDEATAQEQHQQEELIHYK